ncbi:MAG: hypothetical protein KME21_30650, partial [Desmonostoc vinosum HA7617-LM4]|nr:hypothetical protein [Desmonostoc vinosum HA7617-LM4]
MRSYTGGNMPAIAIPNDDFDDFQSKHLQEWLDSGVDRAIYDLNVSSIRGTIPYQFLLYSPNISRRNDGRLRDYDGYGNGKFVTATADIEADLLLRLASNRCLWGKPGAYQGRGAPR